nr:right-handed parallel beta-helix repeat-containing protein [Arthrobacter sp. ov407]
MTGLAIHNNDSVAERVTVQRNGMLGMGVNAAYGLVIRDSIVTFNNTAGFKPAPVAGGIKVTRSRGVTIVNNDTSNNQKSSGIWLDESVYNANVSNNISSSNGYTGIQLELSDTAIVANNETNGQETGILIFDTGNVKIFNNNVGGNSLFGISLSQDERRQAIASFAGQDPRQPAVDPTVPWLTRNIAISNNVFGNGGRFQFYALDKATRIPVDNMNVSITGNLFNKRVALTDPCMVAWGGNDGSTLVRYETPSALAAAKGTGWKNAITDGSLPIGQMAALASKSASIAVPLPQDVAKAIGKPAGSMVVGRF